MQKINIENMDKNNNNNNMDDINMNDINDENMIVLEQGFELPNQPNVNANLVGSANVEGNEGGAQNETMGYIE